MASFSNFKSTIVQASQTAAGVATGVTVYANTDALPYVGNSDGDQAYVSSNSRLYIWQGSGWYNVALINRAPNISAVQDSDGNTTPFTLAVDGTVTTITITAADSDGDPITYSAVADSDFNGLATVSDSDNVFTITPFSQDSASTTSGTITFRATDGVNIASSGVQTFTLSFLSALWDETVLSIGTNSTNGLANKTFIDRSTNAHTVTTAGTPTQTAFHPYLDYWSVEFTEDTMTIPSSAEFNVGNGDFTFETWINTTRNGGTIFDFGGNYLITYNGFNTTFTSDGYLKMTLNQQSNSDAGQFILTGSTKINDGKWNHIRITRTGTTFRFFVNGVLDVSGTSSVTGYQAGSAFVIGGSLSNNSPTSALTGHLADFRLIKGNSLNTTDDSFDVPTDNLTNVSGTSLLLFNRNRFIDLSSTGHSLTNNGAKISAFNPFGQESEYAAGENKGSAFFDGSTNNQLNMNGESDFGFGTGDFLIEAWFYPTNPAVVQLLWDFRQLSSQTDIVFSLDANTLAPRMNAANTTRITGSALPSHTWHHFVLSRVSGSTRLFVNGSQDGVTYSDGTSYSAHAGRPIFGNHAYNTTKYPASGYFSGLRVIKGSGVTSVTVPTSPVGNTNASLYLPMDNAGIYDKTGNHTLTLVGDTSTSTSQTKFANTAMYFDGSGDYIDTTPLPAFGTEDFTIEFWFRASTINSNYKALIDTRGAVSDPGVWIHNTNKLYYYASETQAIIGTTTLVQDVWYHAAACRSNGVTKLFLNGTQESGNYSDTASYTSSPVRIGQRYTSTAYNFHGYIENLQILNGVAKYTANFTPPTQEQGRTYQAED